MLDLSLQFEWKTLANESKLKWARLENSAGVALKQKEACSVARQGLFCRFDRAILRF